ncbi:MAG: MarR family winged helix-turn-helix transcriptional regulator [Sneathiella sp.]
MADPEDKIYATITDLMVAMQDSKLRFLSLRQPIQWDIIWHIEQAQMAELVVDITSIANATNHSRNSIAKHVETLRENEFLILEKDPKDSRRTLIVPTEKLRLELKNFTRSISPFITEASFNIQREEWIKRSKN